MKPAHAIALAAVVVLVVAALALPRRSAIVNAPAADSKPEAHDPTPQPTEPAPVAPAEPDRTPAREVEAAVTAVVQPAAQTPVVSQSSKKLSAKPTQKPAVAAPMADARYAETSAKEHEVATLPVPAPATPVPAIPSVDVVTITGCLEASGNGDRFRLTDTEGATAPKSRSWRSGFLKKRTASVDLVGAHDVAALHKQVGQRVAVSGVQTDRELKVSSVRVVAPSCN